MRWCVDYTEGLCLLPGILHLLTERSDLLVRSTKALSEQTESDSLHLSGSVVGPQEYQREPLRHGHDNKAGAASS